MGTVRDVRDHGRRTLQRSGASSLGFAGAALIVAAGVELLVG
jgi:hypothetical protein